MDTSSVSKQEKQSPEAVSKSESIIPLDESESADVCSLVLFELSMAVPSSGWVRALVGLEGGLEDPSLCYLKLGLVSGINSGM